ncbi:hypothetical protein F66182_954 [Fusarium sp. NRRL 66182]|nr:hypothetical protein F66182_954 [Fusarium sp. NRRL 66182]
MKPVFVSLTSMALLASAHPIVPGSASSLAVRGDAEPNFTLDTRAILAPESNVLQKRGNKRMTLPFSVGTAVQNIGAIVVKAIVDAAGEIVLQISNPSSFNYQVSFRDIEVRLDARTVNVASHHTVEYEVMGKIKPRATISIHTQLKN